MAHPVGSDPTICLPGPDVERAPCLRSGPLKRPGPPPGLEPRQLTSGARQPLQLSASLTHRQFDAPLGARPAFTFPLGQRHQLLEGSSMHLTNGVSVSSTPIQMCQWPSIDDRRSVRWSARIVTPSMVLNHSPPAAPFSRSARRQSPSWQHSMGYQSTLPLSSTCECAQAIPQGMAIAPVSATIATRRGALNSSKAARIPPAPQVAPAGASMFVQGPHRRIRDTTHQTKGLWGARHPFG